MATVQKLGGDGRALKPGLLHTATVAICHVGGHMGSYCMVSLSC